jgi:hypothetical protein
MPIRKLEPSEIKAHRPPTKAFLGRVGQHFSWISILTTDEFQKTEIDAPVLAYFGINACPLAEPETLCCRGET